MEVFLGIYLQPTAVNGTVDTEVIYSRMRSSSLFYFHELLDDPTNLIFLVDANIAAIQKWGTRNVCFPLVSIFRARSATEID